MPSTASVWPRGCRTCQAKPPKPGVAGSSPAAPVQSLASTGRSSIGRCTQPVVVEPSRYGSGFRRLVGQRAQGV